MFFTIVQKEHLSTRNRENFIKIKRFQNILLCILGGNTETNTYKKSNSTKDPSKQVQQLQN